ncbi:putative quinol monooxygenase [Undibacterium terreum]|uniref:Antibiotic biosynthesis monooxygenase n=1 Tax=Undibacterium terreum TaxID=1224302 RepID=A0A916XFS6_9BURK|nr:antibiotic biosynthesis monooxygenase family protein [Undibacterium terreum]GGC70300.1 antibiotic biosynthesis monooxygenase [Undibacterium terreum]
MSAATQITVVARWQLADNALSEVLSALGKLRLASLEEPGCLGYEVYQSMEAQHHSLLLLERYRDNAALDAHRQSAHYQTLVVGRILPLLKDRRVEFLQARDPA